MAIVSIIAEILSELELAKKIKDVSNYPHHKYGPRNVRDTNALMLQALDKVIPEPPKELIDKHRWMQITLKNATQFDLRLDNTYFNSGKYWTAPGGSSPFDQNVFSICNKDYSPVTGASGGNTFHIVLDKDHSFSIALGWMEPKAGRAKAGIVESTNPEDGFNAATSDGVSIDSANQYEGKDKDGNPIKIYFHVSATPGSKSMFVITQIRIE